MSEIMSGIAYSGCGPYTENKERMQKFKKQQIHDIFLKTIYNHFHNILRLFDVLPNFPFTTSERMGDY